MKLMMRLFAGALGAFFVASAALPQSVIPPGSVLGNPTASDAPARASSTMIRAKLTANRTIYVRTNGADALTCGTADTAAAACRTIQYAYNLAANGLDFSGYIVTIKLADGSYTGGLLANKHTVGQPGPEGLQVVGNDTTPANVIVSVTSADAFSTTANGTGLLSGFYVSGLEIRTTTGGNAIAAYGGGSQIIFGKVRFGTVAASHIFATHAAFIIQLGNAYSVVGNAASGHAVAAVGAAVAIHGAQITFANSPAIAAFAQAYTNGQVFTAGLTYVNKNTVTGQRFFATSNGVIAGDTALDALPGDLPGTVNSGALYGTYEVPGPFKLITGVSSYNVTENDRGLMVDASLGNVDINLPAASNYGIGTTLEIRKYDSTANNVILNAAVGGNIIYGNTGGPVYGISKPGAGIQIRSYAVNWYSNWNTSDWTGNTLPVTVGGTGSAHGFGQNLILLGGGTDVALTTVASPGTTTTVLHGNASGPPSWGAVSLTADVSGVLPATNGGTGSAGLALNLLVLGGGVGSPLGSMASPGTTTTVLHGNASGPPTFGAVSLTADVSGALPIANGGTNNGSLAVTLGGIPYADGSKLVLLAPTATARQMFQSGAGAAPSWSTTTWPATTTANRILYSSATSVIGEITSANNSVLVTDGSGVPSLATTLPNVAHGTPTSITLTNGTGLPIATGVSGLGSNVAAFLASASSANLASAITDETGTGPLVFGTSPAIATPVITGFTNASTAASGIVGEPLDASAALGAVTLTASGTAYNVTSVSLTAGDWEVNGVVYMAIGGASTLTSVYGSLGTTSATTNTTVGQFSSFDGISAGFGTNAYVTLAIPSFRVSVSGTTIYYLVGKASFGGAGSPTAGGSIHARRVR